MTEDEWVSLTIHPHSILEFLRAETSDRKFRLFACACCRQIWAWIEDEASRNAVEVAERFADAKASGAELVEAAAIARSIAQAACDAVRVAGNVWQPAWVPAQAALTARFASMLEEDDEIDGEIERKLVDAMDVANNTLWHARVVAKQKGLEDPLLLVHESFGNPFRPVVVDPAWMAWNFGTLVKIARGIYDERAFDRLPILADALEEAGCTDSSILNHCRRVRQHVRGCWVVDLVLGKK